MTNVGQRLLKARKMRGLSQLQLAAGTKATPPLISMVEHGRSNLSVGNLTAAAAKALGVSVDFLCGLTTDPTPAARLAKELAASNTRVRDIEEQAGALVPDDADYVGVCELAGAAGGGAVVEHERVTGRVKFRRAWLARHGLAAAECRVIQVLGESMQPTLFDGCSILVNHASRRRRIGRIFVIRTGDGLVVKRAGKDRAGVWQLVSDNPNKDAWPTYGLAGGRSGDRRGQVGRADVRVMSYPTSPIVSEIDAAPARAGAPPGQIIQLTVATGRRKPRAASQDMTPRRRPPKAHGLGTQSRPRLRTAPRLRKDRSSFAATVRANGIPHEPRSEAATPLRTIRTK